MLLTFLVGGPKPHQQAKLKDSHIRITQFWSLEGFMYDNKQRAAGLAVDIFHFHPVSSSFKLGMAVDFLGTLWVLRRWDDVVQPAGSSERRIWEENQ